MSDWRIILELAYQLGGGPTGLRAVDWFYRNARKLGIRWKPDSTVDLLARLGPHGDKFLPWKRGLNLKKLKRATHGVDLGPMEPGIAHRVVHADRKMHLDPPVLLDAIDHLATLLDATTADDGELLLIGRRDLRSNNSWMHNVPGLVSGHSRCVLLVHPNDAARSGVRDGDTAILESRVFTGTLPVRLSDDMREGVGSLPHGWGHAEIAHWQSVAGANAGVSINNWTDDQAVERVVGQSILNGVRVRLRSLPEGAAIASQASEPASAMGN